MDRKKEKAHFLMDEKTVIDFVKNKTDFFEPEASLQAKEIGDGNINYVFRVKDEKSGKSLIVKQADKLLRSSGRMLNVDRNRLEALFYTYSRALSEDYFPKLYAAFEDRAAFIMEDISAYENMRKALSKGKIFPTFGVEMVDYFTSVLLPTTEFFLGRHEKRRRAAEFLNIELCDISEDLVLTEPYFDYKGRNIITEGLEDFVREKLYEDEELKTEVGKLRYVFINKAEALIHGDLHSGSIFIREDGFKVIDPEFCFYGPMGYDIGNVIAHLFFPLSINAFSKEREAFVSWLKDEIRKIFDGIRKAFFRAFYEKVSLSLYNKAFQFAYIDKILAESLGFAGCELIRRVVGDAKVAELSSLSNLEEKRRAEKILIELGIILIKEREKIKEGKEILFAFERLVKAYEAL